MGVTGRYAAVQEVAGVGVDMLLVTAGVGIAVCSVGVENIGITGVGVGMLCGKAAGHASGAVCMLALVVAIRVNNIAIGCCTVITIPRALDINVIITTKEASSIIDLPVHGIGGRAAWLALIAAGVCPAAYGVRMLGCITIAALAVSVFDKIAL